jgi:hypothetical protein
VESKLRQKVYEWLGTEENYATCSIYGLYAHGNTLMLDTVYHWDDSGVAWDSGYNWDKPVVESGYLESPVLDVGQLSTILIVSKMSIEAPVGSTVRVSLRTSEDGSTWSEYEDLAGKVVTARYLQFKIEIATSDINSNVCVRDFALQCYVDELASHVGAGGDAHALVTPYSAGFMSPADKTKLDGIQAGAEVNQNAYSNITDGTNVASAGSKTDTFKLRSANNILTIAVTNNDSTHGDNALFTINQGNIDHGSIAGLTDDDHGQYVHVSTARTISAVHTFNPSSASAPFILGSNAQGRLVTGLNADKLDGYDASYFASASHNHDSTYLKLSGGSLTGDISFSIGVNSASKGLVWSGLTDTHKIFVEEYGGSESTRLVIYNSDNGATNSDYTVIRVREYSTNTNRDVFEARYDYLYTPVQFRSGVATGTPPFSVTSTTKVTNLNVDMVDDCHVGNSANNILKLDSSGLVPLSNLPSHKSTHATGGSDALTPADIGAVNKAGDTMTGILNIPGLNVTIDNGSVVIFGRQDGNTGNFRFLNLFSDGYHYFQVGKSPSDTTAKLRFSRFGSTSSLAEVEFLTDSLKVNGSVVWHAGNDGTGSGLDADLLDGMQPSTSATANTIVQRDTSGNITANTFNGVLNGNASTASKLQTARTVTLSGDVTGSTSFDGSSNVTITTTLANSGVAAGTYTKVTVDAKGRVTSGATLSVSDIPSHKSTHASGGSDPLTPADIGAVNKAGDTMTGQLVVPSLKAMVNIPSSSPPSAWPTGLVYGVVYNNGYPVPYGTVISIKGTNGNSVVQLLQAWPGTDGGEAYLYIRSARDVGTDVFGSWRKVWSENNDGSGSGLDADLLDGAHLDDVLCQVWMDL